MSILKVANIHFDVAGTNRISYIGTDNVVRVAAGAIKLPVGNTANRPTGEEGLIRYNSETGGFEGRNATAWGAIGGAGTGSGATLTIDVVNSTRYITFSSGNTGSFTLANVSNNLTFNPSTGTLGATIFNSTSDINKKTNITPIENPLEIIDAINGVRFDWRETGLPSLGVIAQEVEVVLPALVGYDKSVNYNGLIAVLIEAVKELKAQVKELKSK